MVERREAGLTLEKIGAEFGVSRERARQLIGAQS
jgi:DNA-directed RNA polymerase sigma subunit (sigma70/sigma32)